MEKDAQDASRVEAVRIGGGALVAVVGPSGAGKDTLIRAARAELDGDRRFHFVRRLVTRPPSFADEDHDAIDAAAFDRMAETGAYAMIWRAHGLGYALPLSLDAAVARGCVAVANLSRDVLALARQRYARCLTIEITAAPDVLFQRICARGRESADDVRRRVARDRGRVEGPDVVHIDNGGPLAAAQTRFLRTLRDAAERDRAD